MHICNITLYPVKSLRGIDISEREVDAFGLRGDRRWMVVDPEGTFITQRQEPRMALLSTALDGDAVIVSWGNGEACRLDPAATRDETLRVTVWSSRVPARTVPPEIDTWFSGVLGRPVRIVHMGDDAKRRVNGRYGQPEDRVSFADGYPVLLIGQSSLDDLNARLDQPVPMDRFRPNIVVADSDPFAEDTWKQVRLGDVPFDVVKPCSRCVITTVDQKTGESGKEPLQTLATYRKHRGKVLFGQNLIQRGRGTLRVGDPVEVVAEKKSTR